MARVDRQGQDPLSRLTSEVFPRLQGYWETRQIFDTDTVEFRGQALGPYRHETERLSVAFLDIKDAYNSVAQALVAVDARLVEAIRYQTDIADAMREFREAKQRGWIFSPLPPPPRGLARRLSGKPSP